VKCALELSLQDAAYRESGGAVRASVEKDSGTAVLVTPDHQALTQTLDSNRPVPTDLLGKGNRVPIIPEPDLKPCRNVRRYLDKISRGHGYSLL